MYKIKNLIINKAIKEKHYISFIYEGRVFPQVKPLDTYEMTDTLYLRTEDFQVFEVEKLEKLTITNEKF